MWSGSHDEECVVADLWCLHERRGNCGRAEREQRNRPSAAAARWSRFAVGAGDPTCCVREACCVRVVRGSADGSADQREHTRELTVSGPSTEEEISNAERELGVQFPPEYREFLAKYGAARIAGYQIAGLTHQDPDEPPVWVRVVRATRSLRDEHQRVGNYDDLVAVSGDGMDVTFYLGTTGNAAGRVLALGPGVEKEVARTFSEFIRRIHSGELSVD